MKNKVFFHRADELPLKTRVSKGRAWLDDVGLHIDAPDGLTIQANDILSAELFRLHGLGRIIQVEYRGGRLLLSVVRLMIGQFAFINFFRTGELQKQLASLAKPASEPRTPHYADWPGFEFPWAYGPPMGMKARVF